METQLKELLNNMDVPEKRKELNLQNLRWLGRNLAIQNRNHPDFPMAKQLLATLLTQQGDSPFILE